MKESKKFGRLIFALLVPSFLAVWSLKSMQGTIPYSDDFEMIIKSKSVWHDVFVVEIGWFFPIQKLIYGLLAHGWGLQSYLPYRLMGVSLVWLTGVILAFRYLRTSPIFAVVVPFWFATLAGAFHTLLWPAASWTLSGVIALLLIEYFPASNSDKINRFDFFSFAISSLVLLSSGPMGVPFVMAIGVIRFRKSFRLAPLFALMPIIIYGLIILLFSSSGGTTGPTPLWANFQGSGNYVLRAFLASANTFTGFSELGPIAVVVVGALYVRNFKEFSIRQRQNHLAWVSGTLLYWALLALTRGHLGEPGAPRYTIVGALTFLILMSDSLVANFKLSKSKLTVWCFAVTATLVVSSNWNSLEMRTNDFQYLSGIYRAKFAALDLVAQNVPLDFAIDQANLPQFEWSLYIEAIESKGSPAYSWKELANRPLSERQVADEIIFNYSSWERITSGEVNGTCMNSSIEFVGSSIMLTNRTDSVLDAKVSGFSLTELWSLQVPANSSAEFRWSGGVSDDLPFKVDLNGLSSCSKK